MNADTNLSGRDGLPDALRVLVREFPRDMWESHAHFDGLTRFWLERHLLFRDLLARLRTDVEALVEREADPLAARARTGRLAQFLVTNLEGHHQIEDMHYFPRLSALEPRLVRGFDILDQDHHALDGHLSTFAGAMNSLFSATPGQVRDHAGRIHHMLSDFDVFLDRHLLDEEDLVVPIILKHGADMNQ